MVELLQYKYALDVKRILFDSISLYLNDYLQSNIYKSEDSYGKQLKKYTEGRRIYFSSKAQLYVSIFGSQRHVIEAEAETPAVELRRVNEPEVENINDDGRYY